MPQMLIQSFVRGEVTVGVVLTLLLMSGRNAPHTIAYSLGGIAMFLLLQGLIPVSKRGPGRLQASAKGLEPRQPDTESSKTQTPKLEPLLSQQMTDPQRSRPVPVHKDRSPAASFSPKRPSQTW